MADEGAGINDRRVKLSRGKYLGGCSGCNGTLCIRGTKQDYDDWGLEGWSGEEFFGYMRKVGRPDCFWRVGIGSTSLSTNPMSRPRHFTPKSGLTSPPSAMATMAPCIMSRMTAHPSQS